MLELALFVVGSVDRVTSSALIAVAVVGATRILAYVREKTAHELAKAIPLAFAFLLLTGGALNLEDKIARVADRPDALGLTDTMVVFLVALEIGLGLAADGSSAALGWIRRRRGGVESDLGVWRTLWAALRRPVRRALPGPVDGGLGPCRLPPGCSRPAGRRNGVSFRAVILFPLACPSGEDLYRAPWDVRPIAGRTRASRIQP
ncbi:MAG: hypothetical protein OEV61_11275 [Chloroflexota bacterium]|nr:hypothetical protein [Chloroflexota bacterium]MDH5243095.1 hypothetical protein [Chloroflexota bacterium]